MRIALSLFAALILTIIGVVAGHSPLAVLTFPARVFNHVMGFEGGPPEEGVLYGLSFNILAIAGILALALSALKRLRRTNADRGS